jgi:hypothetical protein
MIPFWYAPTSGILRSLLKTCLNHDRKSYFSGGSPPQYKNKRKTHYDATMKSLSASRVALFCSWWGSMALQEGVAAKATLYWPHNLQVSISFKLITAFFRCYNRNSKPVTNIFTVFNYTIITMTKRQWCT